MNKSFSKEFGLLFDAIQLSGVLPDSKTFVDSIPRLSPARIKSDYIREKERPGFDLLSFYDSHFDRPASPADTFQADPQRPIEEHIDLLWDVLTRKPENQATGGTLIPLPRPYIVPGGRFGEIYYWDSYFTMLGLQVAGKVDLIQDMVDNFAWLIDTLGFIPNGNRSYYLDRSQPPFFSFMVSLLAEEKGNCVLAGYLPALEAEYGFWLRGNENNAELASAQERVVNLEEKRYLNRYWSGGCTPREESWREDRRLANTPDTDNADIYRELRAACESGWDFSARWFRDGKSMKQIRVTELLPPDLNALLLHLETTLAKACRVAGLEEKSRYYRQQAETRADTLRRYCWDIDKGIFTDYDSSRRTSTGFGSLATVYPLFLEIADEAQAASVAVFVEKDLLRLGGVVTTASHSGQQWDAPNGWAPLQWITIKGLRNYGFRKLADTIRSRWIDLNCKVYRNTGKIMEKYNVTEKDLPAGGGEYPLQDGFGWSNGVLLKLLSEGN